MTKMDENPNTDAERGGLRSISRKLTKLKTRYTSHRDAFQDNTPFGLLIWDISRIILAVVVISSLMIGLTGLTTPFVAVSSGSMEPNIMTGDLVITAAPSGSPPLASTGSIETSRNNTATTSFNKHGDVIVFRANQHEVPVIHRAYYHTEKGENWVENVEQNKLPENISCTTLETCPAPRTGYITLGDNNPHYDQAAEYDIVTENNIIGVAEYRVPYLGWVSIGTDFITN